MVLGGPERAAIHKLHRISGIFAATAILIAGFGAIRAGRDLRTIGIALIALVTIEFSLGVAAVISGLPIGVAVAHNWIAALLILTTIKLLSESQTASG